MGTKTVNCARCAKRLTDDLIDIEQKSFCKACFAALLAEASEEDREKLVQIAQAPPTTKVKHKTTVILPPDRLTEPKAPSLAKRYGAKLIWMTASCLGMILALGVGYLLGHRTEVRPAALPSEPPPSPAREITPEQKSSLLDSYELVRKFSRIRPDDLDTIVSLYQKVAEEAKGTPTEREITRELAAFEAKLLEQFDAQGREIDQAIEPILAESRYGIAIAAIDAHLPRHKHDAWGVMLRARVDGIIKRAEAEAEPILKRARTLLASDQRDEAAKEIARLDRFGIDKLKRAGKELLSPEVKTPTPPPPPPPPPPPVVKNDKPIVDPAPKPEPPKPDPPKPATDDSRDRYQKMWDAAVVRAKQRDYDRALGQLETFLGVVKDPGLKSDVAEDVRILKLASSFYQGASAAFGEVPKQKAISIRFSEDGESVRTARGKVAGVSSAGVSLLESGKTESTLIPFSEILADCIVEFYKSKDVVAVASFLIFEGEIAQAKKVAGDQAGTIPDRFWAIKQEEPKPEAKAGEPGPKPPKDSNKDEEAQGVFDQAERDFAAGKFDAAVPKYQELLSKYRSAKVTKDNRKQIQERADYGKDSVFMAKQMTDVSTFTLQNFTGAPVDQAYVLGIRGRYATFSAYLEVNFYARANEPYRIWIHTGGDCKSTMTVGLQYPEAVFQNKPAEIGSQNYVTLFPNGMNDHNPCAYKTDKWAWNSTAQVFKTSGMKKLRVYGMQGGLAISTIVISSGKYREVPPDPKSLK